MIRFTVFCYDTAVTFLPVCSNSTVISFKFALKKSLMSHSGLNKIEICLAISTAAQTSSLQETQSK